MISKEAEDRRVKEILKLCVDEGTNKKTGKWTFGYKDLIVQCVSVFAIHAYIQEESKQSFRDWLFDKTWAEINNGGKII